MSRQQKVEELTEKLSSYANTNIELIKLEITENTSTVASSLSAGLFIGLIGILFLLFGSLSLGYYLSELLGSKEIGFGIIAGCYFLFGIIAIIFRKKLIIQPVRDLIIRKALNKKNSTTI